jgi:hypothetical protein
MLRQMLYTPTMLFHRSYSGVTQHERKGLERSLYCVDSGASCTAPAQDVWNTSEGEMRMTTVKTFLITASCGMVLLGAVSAHARDLNGFRINGLAINGLELNGREMNGYRLNGLELNGREMNGYHLNGLELNGREMNGQNLNGTSLNGTPAEAQNEGLSFNGLSQKPLGKR